MTHIAAFVNLSNWDGENYVVQRRRKRWNADRNEYEPNPAISWEEVEVSPSKFVLLNPEMYEYRFEEKDNENTEPFLLNRKQVFPNIHSFFSESSAEEPSGVNWKDTGNKG